jgi:tetratricopeptide (TPR) repeat protein
VRAYPFALAIAGLVLCGAMSSTGRPPFRQETSGQVQQSPIPAIGPPSLLATSAELENQGDDLRNAKAYEEAIRYYRAALEKLRAAHLPRPQAQLYNKIGIAELQEQNTRAAERDFRRALRLDHELVEARNNLGAAYYMQKKYFEAIREYQEAIKLRDDASFHSNLGTAYFMRQDYSAAMAEYSRAAQLDPNVFEHSSQTGISAQLSSPASRAKYSFMLAKMYAKAGDLDHCIFYLKKAMEDGYKQIDSVYQDDEFAALRKDPRFTELMKNKPPAIPE